MDEKIEAGQAEQWAIADALRDADELISALDKIVAKKRDIKQAAMQQLLMGKRRLPGFSGDWDVRPFGAIASLRKDRIDPRASQIQEFCIELEHIEQGTGKVLGNTTT